MLAPQLLIILLHVIFVLSSSSSSFFSASEQKIPTPSRMEQLWHQVCAIYRGEESWLTLLPSGWLDRAMETPGSAYIVAFVYWLRHPLLLCFMLPLLIVLFIYCTLLLVHLYRLRYWLTRHLRLFWESLTQQPDDDDDDGSQVGSDQSERRPSERRGSDRSHRRRRSSFYYRSFQRADLVSIAQLLRHVVAAFWDAHGRIFHAYEVVGMDKLPISGPAFVVYYHGTCPFDAYYMISRHCIERDRFPVAVVDRFLFRLPGLRYLLDLVGAIEGTVEECAACLNPNLRNASDLPDDVNEQTEVASNWTAASSNSSGSVVLLAPGGVREALFADESYSVLWGQRCGFAKVALLARQPIYPMFTENIRETIRVVQFGKSFWQWLYEHTRLPFALFYGYFPVKLRTYIGDPIYPIEGETPEELALRTKASIEQLICDHQSTPSNLFCALLQRLPAFDRWFETRKQRRNT